MLFECPAGLGAVRLGMVALRFGGAMRMPPFGGEVFGLLACGALARNTQIDDFTHDQARPPNSIEDHSAPIVPTRWRQTQRNSPLPECNDGQA